MASLRRTTGKNRNGWQVRFYLHKVSKCISLPPIDETTAKQWQEHIGHLVECFHGERLPERPTAKWLDGLSDDHHAKISAHGLAAPRAQAAPKPKRAMALGAFLDSFYKNKSNKESSQTVWSHTRKRLIEYFGADKPLAEITTMDARDFRNWLRDQSNKRDKAKEDGTIVPLAENTVRRRIGFCREIFSQAIEDGLITKNPFKSKALPVTCVAVKERQHYVDHATFAKVLQHAPNARWRALLVLCRIGTLRVPSEAIALRWCHIAWDAGRLTVNASKTEHHRQEGKRVVPLFPEIREALSALWLEAPEKADYVFPDLRADTNLRTGLERILERAGVQQWPRLWQNLRSSAATDLANSLPAPIAAAICGHTVEVARKHYWTVTDDALETALAGHRVHSGVHKAVAKVAKVDGNEPIEESEEWRNSSENANESEGQECNKAYKNKGQSGRHWLRTPMENTSNLATSPAVSTIVSTLGPEWLDALGRIASMPEEQRAHLLGLILARLRD